MLKNVTAACHSPVLLHHFLKNLKCCSTRNLQRASETVAMECSMQNSDERPTPVSQDESEPKLSKRARRKLLTKAKEKERREAQRSKHKVDSMTNNSDVLNGKLMAETEYYFENGLRKVYPYFYEFTAYAKGRWVGRSLLDVFLTEFKYSSIPLLQAIEAGRITINGKMTSGEYKIKSHDYIVNKTHRHELPVLGGEIEILADTDQVLVVNKPSSMPIHPCGRYHYNSLTYILAEETGYRNLRSIYRLDRLTSGVMIFCKVEGLARTMIEHIKERQVQKEYISRVEGEFPSGIIECEEPLDVLCPKTGLQKVTKNGKPAHTTFERMSSDGRFSVVKCMPHTGRTHQIRVHLQFLGYPIVNDPLYNHDAWGPNKGKNGEFGKSEEQLLEDLNSAHESDQYLVDPDKPVSFPKTNSQNVCDQTKPDITSTNQTNPVEYDSCESVSSTKKSHCSENVKDKSVKEEDSSASLNRKAKESTVTTTQSSDQLGSPGISSDATGHVDSLDCKNNVISDTDQSLMAANTSDSKTSGINLTSNKRTSDCDIVREHKVQKCDPNLSDSLSRDCVMSSDNSEKSETPERPSKQRLGFDQSKMTYDELCTPCQQTFRDPLPKELVMYLHAYSYQGPDWKYTTSLPEWAQETWTET